MSSNTMEPVGGVRVGPPSAGQRRRLLFSDSRGQVALGRDFAREALADWNWPVGEGTGVPTAGDDVLLLVSELLANACLHAGGARELALAASVELLRVEVLDGSTAPPTPMPYRGAGLPGGHGLHIVERLSDRWGVALREGGKTVWFEIEGSRLARR